MVIYEQNRCVDINGLEVDGVGLTQKLDLFLKCRGFRVQVSQVKTDAMTSGFRFERVAVQLQQWKVV
jgi:hypothetical protein